MAEVLAVVAQVLGIVSFGITVFGDLPKPGKGTIIREPRTQSCDAVMCLLI